MSILDETRFLERFQFFNGQRLFASDLQGADDFNREMRWLHIRSLHEPGIGSGFAVYGKKEDREVVISAGYAADALGREIVLTSTMTLQVPPVAGDDNGDPIFYDLAVSYPDDSELEETETRDGVCLPRGVVRRREVPVLCWIKLNANLQPIDARLKQEVLTGMRLILARAEVLNCQLNKDLSIAERRNARPSRLPFIACGEETPTAWTVLKLAEADTSPTAVTGGILCAFVAANGLSARVDTSAAGFQVTPGYTARITGPRIIRDASNNVMAIVDGLLNVQAEGATANGFTAEVLLLAQPFSPDFAIGGWRRTMDPPEAVEFLKLFQDWRIVWMGIES